MKHRKKKYIWFFSLLLAVNSPKWAFAQQELWDEIRAQFEKTRPSFSIQQAFGQPQISLEDKGDQYSITITGKNLNPEGLNVSIEQGMLVVQYTSKQETDPKKSGNTFFSFQSAFSQTIQLPDDIDPESLVAEKQKDGMIITLQKKKNTFDKSNQVDTSKKIESL